ncbi:hypothetical protein HPB48_021951 [Haemaphysalis longicornis]|uniref:Peptidase M13 C-terminal domain-containing protein n=1 Tax=Haemaphysalis longicornis TaxID=44386 RepID=A0A9J6G913_HAELO|nr:hypothetical protein HPB48_021951 [Haemaphysalis longicornis]
MRCIYTDKAKRTHVRRSWKQDFRYQRLPQLSSDALFFVYYALDNCESSDVVYKEHAGHWLPADYRVNLPLRHLVEFASLFNCSADTDMGRMIAGHTCNVVSPGTWTGLAPTNTYLQPASLLRSKGHVCSCVPFAFVNGSFLFPHAQR